MSIESKKRLGLALCGSYCTFEKLFAAAEKLSNKYELIPIMSENAAETDTRFGAASEHIKKLMLLSGKKVVTTIAEAEPLGPATPMDALLIAPCTGNTLAKLANGITDTSVTRRKISPSSSTARAFTSCPSARTTRPKSPAASRPISPSWTRRCRPPSEAGRYSPYLNSPSAAAAGRYSLLP